MAINHYINLKMVRSRLILISSRNYYSGKNLENIQKLNLHDGCNVWVILRLIPIMSLYFKKINYNQNGKIIAPEEVSKKWERYVGQTLFFNIS